MQVGLVELIPPTAFGVVATLSRLIGLILLIPLIHYATSGDVSAGRLRVAGLDFEGRDGGPLVYVVLLGGILAAVVVSGLAGYLSRLRLARLTARAESRLDTMVLLRHLRFGQQYYDKSGVAASVKRIGSLPKAGLRALDFVQRSIGSCLGFSAYLAAMALLSWPLALAAVVVLAVYLYFFDRLVQRVDDLSERQEAADERRADLVHDLIQNVPLVRAMGTSDLEAERAAAASNEVAATRLARRKVLDLVGPARELMNVVVIVAFVVASGVFLGTVSGGELVRYLVFFLVFRRAVSEFSAVMSLPSGLEGVATGLNRLLTFLDESDRFVVESGSLPFPGVRREIRLVNLDFRYRPRRRVLRDVSFVLAAGETSFLVGASGSGKTTLFNLLLRAYDCPADSILVDGTDIRRFDTASFLARISYCGPQPLLFNETIRANVTYGLSGIEDRQVWEAADAARATEVIASLPAGLDQVVGERGARLSWGEGQRIALMRVFLRRSEIVLLDEATSALDTATEAEVFQALASMQGRRTIVVIAHRLKLIPAWAPVIVLKKGRVAEQGTPVELLESRGEFSRLWRVGGWGRRELRSEARRARLTAKRAKTS